MECRLYFRFQGIFSGDPVHTPWIHSTDNPWINCDDPWIPIPGTVHSDLKLI